MVLAPSVAGLFKWRQFEPEVILLAVGWYLRFSLSDRDVEELLSGLLYGDRDRAEVGRPPDSRDEARFAEGRSSGFHSSGGDQNRGDL